MRRLYVILPSVGCWLVALGCSSSPTTPTASPSVRTPPKDLSLSEEEYIRMGMPPADRIWSADDMTKAVAVLEKLAVQPPGHLPRRESEQSGRLFARITSTENLASFRDRTVPLKQRMPQAIAYYQAVLKIFATYVIAFKKRLVADSEVVELCGTQLRLSVLAGELVDEFLPTVPKDDPTYANRLAGVDQMKRGQAIELIGALMMLTETNVSGTAERLRLVGYLKETAPVILPRLHPESRQTILARMEDLNKDAKANDLQPALGELHQLLRKAVDGK